MLVLLALAACVKGLGLLVGLATVYYPRTCTCLVLTCVIAPPILLVSAVAISRFRTELLSAALLLSGLLCVITISIWSFSGIWWPQAVRARLFPKGVQFPLGPVEGIAVDGDAFVYLALRNYSRIQKYSSEGEFVSGWFVSTWGGRFEIWAEGDGTIHAFGGGTSHEVFDANGTFIERRKTQSREDHHGASETAGGALEVDANGNVYQIEPSSWSAKVTKITPDGKKTTIIEEPFYDHLLRVPMSWWLMLIGLLMGALCGGLLTLKTSPFWKKWKLRIERREN
ncbi:MAG: hypothetical protein AMK72_08405 [Planctomycetes bacterium SM23_25]|nr:MAG: hypothetical protein AMK72_08405 [Planctomycetes bacterium SM23_25]